MSESLEGILDLKYKCENLETLRPLRLCSLCRGVKRIISSGRYLVCVHCGRARVTLRNEGSCQDNEVAHVSECEVLNDTYLLSEVDYLMIRCMCEAGMCTPLRYVKVDE